MNLPRLHNLAAWLKSSFTKKKPERSTVETRSTQLKVAARRVGYVLEFDWSGGKKPCAKVSPLRYRNTAPGEYLWVKYKLLPSGQPEILKVDSLYFGFVDDPVPA